MMIFPHRRRTADAEGGLKRAGANAPALLGVWGHQPPTSTRRVYTRALLAATFFTVSAILLNFIFNHYMLKQNPNCAII